MPGIRDWLRLAIAGQLDCTPEILSRYAWHDGQLSNQPSPVLRQARARITMLGKAFTADGLLGDNPTLRDYYQISQLATFRDHLLARGHRPAAAELTEETAAIRRRAWGDPLALRSRGDNLARAWSRVAYGEDGVDVLVEVNGIFRRLGRPSGPNPDFLHHHNGTSGVPNVDWVLADAIAAPASSPCGPTCCTPCRTPGCCSTMEA